MNEPVNKPNSLSKPMPKSTPKSTSQPTEKSHVLGSLDRSARRAAYGEYAPYFGLLMRVGVGMILSILIWLGIGLGLEKIWPLGGKLVLVCVLAGVASGFYITYRHIMKVL